MTVLQIAEAAELLGVSEDTVRRWAEAGRLETTRLPSGRQGVDGRVLAAGGATAGRRRPIPGRSWRSPPATGSAASSPGSPGTR